MENDKSLLVTSESACVLSHICAVSFNKTPRIQVVFGRDYGYDVVQNMISALRNAAKYNLPVMFSTKEKKMVAKLLEVGSQFSEEMFASSPLSCSHSLEEHQRVLQNMLLCMNIFGAGNTEMKNDLTNEPILALTEEDRKFLEGIRVGIS